MLTACLAGQATRTAAQALPRQAAPSLAALLRGAQPYLLSPASFPADHRNFATEGAVQLYHLRYEQVVPIGLSALVVQRIFQIRTPAAAATFAPDNVWYDSARGRFHLVRAEVWRRRHGAYAVVGQGRDRGDLPGWAAGTEPRNISLPPLRAGDRVSLLYVVLPDSSQAWALLDGHFVGNLFAFRDSFSTLRARYVLAARQSMAVSAVGVRAPTLGHDAGGFRTWQWEADQLPAFFKTAEGPAITDVSPFVQVSGFTTWQALVHWYSNLLAERATLPRQLTQRLRQIAQSGPGARSGAALSPEQTRVVVARLGRFLAHSLSYRGNEEGVHAYVPAPVAQVFQAGAGDCKDGALLLASWLRAVGVQANLALVRTPAMGPIAPPNASGQVAATIAAFDHALVYIPATGQWLDTTAPHHFDSELPAGDQNSLALIVRPGEQTLVRVPAATAAAEVTRPGIRPLPAASVAPLPVILLATGH